MRVYGILLLFCLLVSLGLLTVLLGQFREMDMIQEKHRSMDAIALDYRKTLEYDGSFQRSLEALVTQGEDAARSLEESLSGINVEQKKGETDACVEETKRKQEELQSMERTRNQTLESLHAEANVWKEEVVSAKARLTAYTPICDHLKNTTEPRAGGINQSGDFQFQGTVWQEIQLRRRRESTAPTVTPAVLSLGSGSVLLDLRGSVDRHQLKEAQEEWT
ncbi:hypothetical protein FQA47_005193 [Oryzias melastigma]|uniref:Uncharacterized protein n=1 Tax=Oryzias melastigma TaxID=30732 RepID=A0A834F3I8_ORYME|nr:hypothetical protein FQA47_005193 [Oryzias melastigma]